MPLSSQAPVALFVFGVGQAEEQQSADAEGCGLFGFADGLDPRRG